MMLLYQTTLKSLGILQIIMIRSISDRTSLITGTLLDQMLKDLPIECILAISSEEVHVILELEFKHEVFVYVIICHRRTHAVTASKNILYV